MVYLNIWGHHINSQITLIGLRYGIEVGINYCEIVEVIIAVYFSLPSVVVEEIVYAVAHIAHTALPVSHTGIVAEHF